MRINKPGTPELDGPTAAGGAFREVLLVDDDAGFVETLRALLEREGLAVIASACDGVQYLTSHTPDAHHRYPVGQRQRLTLAKCRAFDLSCR